jgi:hypothetical protein
MMPRYRSGLPQLSGDIFLTDAGLETDLIFNQGIEIREFAAHTLLPTPKGRAALSDYFEGFLKLAKEMDTGFILDSVTWKAHAHWASSLHASSAELRAANKDSLRFIADLRERFSGNAKPIVLNAVIGPRGDAYKPEAEIAMEAAEDYFTEQLGWLAANLQSSRRSRRTGSSRSHRRSARGRFVHGRDQRRIADWPEPVRRDQPGRRKYQRLSFLFHDQLRSPRPLRWRPPGRSLGAANSRCAGQRLAAKSRRTRLCAGTGSGKPDGTSGPVSRAGQPHALAECLRGMLRFGPASCDGDRARAAF